jgi:putative thioredoxin
MGEEVLADGDARARFDLPADLDMAPRQSGGDFRLAARWLAADSFEEARTLLSIGRRSPKDPAIARARSVLTLAEVAPANAETAAFEQRIAADPDDHEARYELAAALMANGDRDGAADQLFEIIQRDREWNEGAARKRLLQFLEVVGLEDPWAGQQRRRLSAILFT